MKTGLPAAPDPMAKLKFSQDKTVRGRAGRKQGAFRMIGRTPPAAFMNRLEKSEVVA